MFFSFLKHFEKSRYTFDICFEISFMGRLCICLVLLITALYPGRCCQTEDSVIVVFWNLENFFDYSDDGNGDSDKEFSPSGSRCWTRKRFYIKCDAISKSLLWMKDRYGRMPDIIGLAEVENKKVLWNLLEHTLLRKYDYGIVHYESHDRRGIDVALLYRKSIFNLLSSSVRRPECGGRKLDTRDILHVCLTDCRGNDMNFMVNHHPSKYGGSFKSEERRNASISLLKEMCDSVMNIKDASIVVMGDFNDTPDAERFGMLDGILVNKAVPHFETHEGTIRFKGKWELIDMFMVTRNIEDNSYMEILKIPFLMTYDRVYPGEKPLRTYTGPRYTGGVSDHCPIVLLIKE